MCPGGTVVAAASEEGGNLEGFGVLFDDRMGRKALHAATSSGAWVGRPIEASGVFPLQLEAEGEITEHLADWPLTQTVKVLCAEYWSSITSSTADDTSFGIFDPA